MLRFVQRFKFSNIFSTFSSQSLYLGVIPHFYIIIDSPIMFIELALPLVVWVAYLLGWRMWFFGVRKVLAWLVWLEWRSNMSGVSSVLTWITFCYYHYYYYYYYYYYYHYCYYWNTFWRKKCWMSTFETKLKKCFKRIWTVIKRRTWLE